MKALLPLLVLATTLLVTSCNDSGSKASSAKAAGSDSSSFTSNVSAEENAALDKQIQAMFKHSVFSSELTQKDGCKITLVDQVSILRDDANESIVYKKSLSSSASKQCGAIHFDDDARKVVVAAGDTCERTYEKDGNKVKMKSCDSISIIDLNTKTATMTQVEDGETINVTIRAVSLPKSELESELKNVTIVYTKSDVDGSEIEDSREIGNALELLKITL